MIKSIIYPMKKSDGEEDYFVTIVSPVGEKSLFKFDEKWKAEYECDHLNHILRGWPRPDLREYGWTGAKNAPQFVAYTIFLNPTHPDCSGLHHIGNFRTFTNALDALDKAPMPTPIDFRVHDSIQNMGNGHWVAQSYGCLFCVQCPPEPQDLAKAPRMEVPADV